MASFLAEEGRGKLFELELISNPNIEKNLII